MIQFLKNLTGRYFWPLYLLVLIAFIVWCIHTINRGHEAILREMP